MLRLFLIATLLWAVALFSLPTWAQTSSDRVGQRLGWEAIRIIEDVTAEGIYHYTFSAPDPSSEFPDRKAICFRTKDSSGDFVLMYWLDNGRASEAVMSTPLSSGVKVIPIFNDAYIILNPQAWQSRNARIVATVIPAEGNTPDKLSFYYTPLR